MNRRTFAILYMLISSIVNIIWTLLVCGLVFVISMLLFKYVFHVKPEFYTTSLRGILILGLVVAFVSYSKISMKIIKKYKFDERFANNASKNFEVKKTVLPNSVIEEEEDDKWKE